MERERERERERGVLISRIGHENYQKIQLLVDHNVNILENTKIAKQSLSSHKASWKPF